MRDRDPSTFDFYLAQTIEVLRARWFVSNTGCVAACLLSDIAPIYDVSRDIGHNLYSHAERNVIETYIREKGGSSHPPPNSVLITTLSPCVGSTSWRVGESCSELAATYGITRLHVGLIDPDHPSHVHGHSFDITETKDPALAAQCVRLRNLFNLKASRHPDGTRGRLVDAYKSQTIFESVFKAKKPQMHTNKHG